MNDAREFRRAGRHEMDAITPRIIGAAIAVHRALGPGLLETTYQVCLASELRHRGLHVDQQVPVRVVYRDVDLDRGYFIDILVERRIVVELKVVEKLHPVFVSQILTYLRLSGHQIGLLINFNVPVLVAGGIRRVVLTTSQAADRRHGTTRRELREAGREVSR